MQNVRTVDEFIYPSGVLWKCLRYFNIIPTSSPENSTLRRGTLKIPSFRHLTPIGVNILRYRDIKRRLAAELFDENAPYGISTALLFQAAAPAILTRRDWLNVVPRSSIKLQKSCSHSLCLSPPSLKNLASTFRDPLNIYELWQTRERNFWFGSNLQRPRSIGGMEVAGRFLGNY